MKQVRVLIVDSRSLVRSGLRALLENIPELHVVGEAEDEGETLRMISECRPDVVLIDDGAPQLNALDLTRRVTDKFPNLQVMVLTEHVDQDDLNMALSNGAAGYLTMTASVMELEEATKIVASGQVHISPSATRALVNVVRPRSVDVIKPLTVRQREVLRLIAEGHSTKSISLILNISVKTVETHRSLLMNRLDIHHVPGLVRYAIREGLIAVEESGSR